MSSFAIRPKSSRRYQYTRLERPESQIRILRLLPSNEFGLINCSLEVRSLEDDPWYVAVSYEWGEHDPEMEMDITIDGKRSRIGHNLWLFLDYLRNHRNKEIEADQFRLWADALCIHQDDLDEKRAQIHLMGEIFGKADHVFAWLGWTTAFDVEQTFKFMRTVASHADRTNGVESARSAGLIPDANTGVMFEKIKAMNYWNSVVRLYQLSYWSRRWIVQEVLFARNLSLLCDGHDLPWTTCHQVFQFLHFLRSTGVLTDETDDTNLASFHDITLTLQRTTPWKIHQYRSFSDSRKADKEPTLYQLTLDFEATRCELVHDRIYALLNLAKERSNLSTDYSCSVLDLLKNVLFLQNGGQGAYKAEIDHFMNLLHQDGSTNESSHRALGNITIAIAKPRFLTVVKTNFANGLTPSSDRREPKEKIALWANKMNNMSFYHHYNFTGVRMLQRLEYFDADFECNVGLGTSHEAEIRTWQTANRHETDEELALLWYLYLEFAPGLMHGVHLIGLNNGGIAYAGHSCHVGDIVVIQPESAFALVLHRSSICTNFLCFANLGDRSGLGWRDLVFEHSGARDRLRLWEDKFSIQPTILSSDVPLTVSFRGRWLEDMVRCGLIALNKQVVTGIQDR